MDKKEILEGIRREQKRVEFIREKMKERYPEHFVEFDYDKGLITIHCGPHVNDSKSLIGDTRIDFNIENDKIVHLRYREIVSDSRYKDLTITDEVNKIMDFIKAHL